MAATDVMKPGHPRWEEFAERLAGPEGCDFRQGPNGISGRCDGDSKLRFSRQVLRAMGFDNASIQASVRLFRRRGGYCDCEVLLNVDSRERSSW